MEAQDIVKQGCRRRIGNGHSTKVWKVPWFPCPTNGFLTTQMPMELAHAEVNNLMEENGCNWDEEILRDICNERDRKLIKQIPIPVRSTEDTWFWLMEDKGEFTVRSCYRRLQGDNERPDASFWKKLWSLKLLGKVLNFLWRTCRNCLPTAAAVVIKQVNVDLLCPWCQAYREDAIHVLFRCSFARDVWMAVGLWELIMMQTTDNVFEVLQGLFKYCSKEQCVIVGLFCWNLWNRRNKWLWDRVNMSVFGVKASALNLLSDWK